MPALSHIDPGSAALLVMDYQVDILTRFMTAAPSADAAKAAQQQPSIAASARPTRSLKGDLAHVEEPTGLTQCSLGAALNFYTPDPPPPGL